MSRRLCSFIKSSNSKTLYKNGMRYVCDETVWTDKTMYSITIFDANNHCIDVYRTSDKCKANEYYTNN